MEAIILAAGLGTRLRPLTDRVPKALIEVAGVPILERVARRVIDAGVDRIVVNTHHHAERIEAFIRDRDGFGAEVLVSRESGDAPLETGGGIKQAATFLALDAPVLVHNVDVITDMDLGALMRTHTRDDLATLAVAAIETRSPLLVDDEGMVGVRYPGGGEKWAREPRGAVRKLAFSGVSMIAPELPALMTETGAFSAIPVYLRLVRAGHRVSVYPIGSSRWIDIGTHDRLEAANRALGGGGA